MSDKTREEFEAFCKIYDPEWSLESMDWWREGGTYSYSYRALQFLQWQHQQTVIDARDAKLHAVFVDLDNQPFGQLELQEEHHLQANALFKIRKILEGRS